MLEGEIMELKEKLVKLRMERKMSQGELAAKVGVTRQAVSRWERGVAAPSTEKLIALSRLYDVPVERLVGGNLEFQKNPATAVAVAVEDVPPVDKEVPRNRRGWKIAAGAVLAVCLLLVITASVITIWTAVFKEPKDNIIRTDDMEPEYIDLEELAPFDGTWEIIE